MWLIICSFQSGFICGWMTVEIETSTLKPEPVQIHQYIFGLHGGIYGIRCLMPCVQPLPLHMPCTCQGRVHEWLMCMCPLQLAFPNQLQSACAWLQPGHACAPRWSCACILHSQPDQLRRVYAHSPHTERMRSVHDDITMPLGTMTSFVPWAQGILCSTLGLPIAWCMHNSECLSKWSGLSILAHWVLQNFTKLLQNFANQPSPSCSVFEHWCATKLLIFPPR